ncbi:ribonuclease H-like domain, reverse transcriptase, RNA-dependent DNA polymerase [Tanacetum coccineum]
MSLLTPCCDCSSVSSILVGIIPILAKSKFILCDANLEVAFRKSTCYVRDMYGNDLLIGSRGTNLYSITLQEITSPNPICLMAKASPSQAWLWHCRLLHLNFDTINLLSKNDIMIGLPKLKFIKDHLCSSCELGKAKRKTVKIKDQIAHDEQVAKDLHDKDSAHIYAGQELAARITLEEHEKFTHAQLKHRDFEEIQGLYNKEKELVDTFVPIGSEEDERRIKELNTKAEEESSNKDVDNTNKRKKRIRMKRSSKKQKTDADLKEEEQLKTFLSIVPNEEEAINYEVLDKSLLADGALATNEAAAARILQHFVKLFQASVIFADSHNMVAYLEKSEDNADFAEIVDFLNASPIRYALTVSPTVYVSYIKQFWSTAKIKTVNNETQIRAKVDGKTIVIIESSVRRDLHFNDEDGITCLTNTKIFENLQLMGYEKLSDKLTFYKSFFSPQWKYLIHTILQCLSSKSTAWNEFGTNIASAVICLAKKQKFNFSKLIFDGMLRNLDPNSKRFLMYLRFLQLFLNNQIENFTTVFNDEYNTPSHTKKVFANMRRQGKDFLGTVTPLFATMLIQSQAVEGEGSGQPTKPQHTPNTASPSHVEPIPIVASSSQPKKTKKHRKTKRKATEISQSSGPTTLVADETIHEEKEDSVEMAATTATSLDAEQGSGGSPRRQDTMGDRPAQTRVLNLENVKDAQALEIKKLKKRVKKLESKKKSITPQLKRGLFKVRIESSAEKSLGDPKDASKQGRNEIDQDEGIA